ncbi:hypothetical protein P8452_03002 [Trifolium repens]|nr:hypothetical protein P8452_03002 [Trifolium repens]
MSGQASEFKQPNVHAWEAFEKGQDIHMQAAPSQAELLYKNFKMIKEKIIKGQILPPAAEEKRFVTWGTDVPDDLVLDHEKLVEALKKFRVYRVQLVLKMYGLDTTLPLNKAALERKNGKASKQMRKVNWLDELQGIRHETVT